MTMKKRLENCRPLRRKYIAAKELYQDFARATADESDAAQGGAEQEARAQDGVTKMLLIMKSRAYGEMKRLRKEWLTEHVALGYLAAKTLELDEMRIIRWYYLDGLTDPAWDEVLERLSKTNCACSRSSICYQKCKSYSCI